MNRIVPILTAVAIGCISGVLRAQEHGAEYAGEREMQSFSRYGL